MKRRRLTNLLERAGRSLRPGEQPCDPPVLRGRGGRKALVVWKGNPPDSRELSLAIRDLPEYDCRAKVVSSRAERVSKITASVPFLQVPGQIYRVSGENYSRECVLLMSEPFTDSQMKDMTRRVNKFGNFPGVSHIYSMNLRVRGYVQVPPGTTSEGFQGALALGHWFIMSRILEKWKSLIIKRASHESGLAETDLSSFSKFLKS